MFEIFSHACQFNKQVSLFLFPIQAGSFANILKEEYGRYTKECGDVAESLCGIAIVHYDLAMSNVGLKGLGFFTVSYQFITTVSESDYILSMSQE